MNLNNMKSLLIIFFLPIYIFSQGTFRVESGTSIVGSNDPIITLYNTNIQNNTGTNNLGSGTIWGFIGNVPQTINGTYISNFYGLILNNTNGFTLQSNTNISNRLDMVTGDITLGSYSLEIGTSTTNPGILNWTDGTIIGPLKRWFAPSINSTQSSGIFPVGNNSTNRFVTLNYTQAPTDGGYITVEYKNGIPTMTNNYNGLPLYSSDNQIVQNYENQGYFDITPFDYNSSLNTKKYTLTMRGNGLTTVNDRTTIRLIKSPGPTHTTWVSCGDHTSVNGSSNSDFTVTSSNVIGFSWFNFGGNDGSPLPVELLYFEGYKYSTFNNLKWSTVSEHNSDYFQIEHSFDGENWRSVGIKDAAGNSNEKLIYGYSVMIDKYTINYYRLIQFDFNGDSKIYGPIAIDNRISTKKVIRYVNLLGQEVPQTTTGFVFEIYDDGSMIRILK
jgi:hypothetical protein